MLIYDLVSASYSSIGFYLVSENRFLGYGIDYLSSAVVLSKIIKAYFPLAFSIRCNHLGLYHLSVCKKVYGHACRSSAVTVTVIIPLFFYLDIYCLGLLRVGDSKAGSGITCSSCRGISCDCTDLFYGVYLLSSAYVLVKVIKGMCPAFGCFQHISLFFLIVSKESHRYFFRSCTVLVIVIIPSLCYCYAGLARCVSVLYIISVIDCSVVGYCILCDSVSYRCAIIILGKVIKVPLPLVCSCYCLAIYDRSVCEKVDRNAIRSLAVLIAIVIPSLLTGYTCLLCSVSIGYRVTVSCIAVYFRCVA